MTQALLAAMFSFKGRLPRAAYWWSGIGIWAVFAVLFVFLEQSLGREATWILYPPFIWILAALTVKRLHDGGHRSAYALIVLLPVIGPIWLVVVLAFRKGTEGDNQYGPDPLSVNLDYLRVNTP